MAELSTVEEIYDFVANALAAAVDEPWKEIRLQAEVWKTSTGFTGDFTRDPAERGVADLDVDRLGYAVAGRMAAVAVACLVVLTAAAALTRNGDGDRESSAPADRQSQTPQTSRTLERTPAPSGEFG